MTSEPMLQDHLARLTPAQRTALEQRLEALQPVLTPKAATADERHLPFPMTDIQEAYWAGRGGDFAFGNVATHAYVEIDATGLTLDRLEAAWNRLVARHDMLRAVFLPDGRQQVLAEVPLYRFGIQDLRVLAQEDAETRLSCMRQEMSHQTLALDRWPLFDIRACLLDSDQARLHLSFDAITMDMASRRILMREWQMLYHDEAVVLPAHTRSFRDFVLAEQDQKAAPSYVRAKDYWLARLGGLPAAPELPLRADYDRHTAPVFTRRSRVFGAAARQGLERIAKSFGVSLNILLLTAYADVLRLWSRNPAFTLNLTLFNRPQTHAQVAGDFTSLTMLKLDAPGDAGLAARALQLQKTLWRDLDHRQFSGVEVLREIARCREGAGPVMPFVFTSLLAGDADAGWMGTEIYSVSQTPQVWLDLMVIGQGDDLVIHWNAVEGLFPAGMMEDMFFAFGYGLDLLLDGTLDGASGWRSIARALLPAQAASVQAAANATAGPVPTRLLHEPWLAQASAWPTRPAVITPTRTLSHGQLANLASTLGRRLRGHGVRPNMLVAVVMHKGWEQIAAVLAILHSGGAYLPIDPDVPKARLHYLLADANIGIVLTQPQIAFAYPANIHCMTITDEDLTVAPGAPLEAAQTLSDLAYVIYTSGSSGQPKGVAIDHLGAANTVEDINARFSVGPADRVLALSSLSFDLSVYDIFGVLGAGGALVLPAPSGLRDPAHWAQSIHRHGVTLWNSVPALMELLVDYAQHHATLPELRVILLSGDRISLALPPFVRAIAPGAKCISLGGATEASIWSILHDTGVSVPDCATVPYGKPLRNQQFHILAPDGAPCPIFVPGELHIGGIGLARRYWGDAARTAAAFMRDDMTGERLYRTGDRGRYLPDGSIEFLGREDHQIKLHGFRIELGEVEAALATLPAVKEAVVIAADGLAGFLVPQPGCSLDSQQLTQFLRMELPGYMVPGRIFILPALPLTANGKIDRAKLSFLAAPVSQAGKMPPAPDAARIAQIVRQSCRINIPDLDSHFLDLGLNSIDIIRIVNALDTQLGFRPDIEPLYATPTIDFLAAAHAQWAKTPAPHATAPAAPRGAAPLALPRTALPAALETLLRQRRSIRQFTLRPVRMEDLSALLGTMQPNGKNYAYASAGGLYPVQIYLHARQGGVTGLAPGPYFYDPTAHVLRPLGPARQLARSAFSQHQNAPIFEEAGFALLLVAQMQAIEPSYAERSLHLATLEAGLITQTFELTAAACNLGLCQIGSIDAESAQYTFGFSATQKILHVIFGGSPESPLMPDATEEGRLKRLIRRVGQLPPDIARALLAPGK